MCSQKRHYSHEGEGDRCGNSCLRGCLLRALLMYFAPSGFNALAPPRTVFSCINLSTRACNANNGVPSLTRDTFDGSTIIKSMSFKMRIALRQGHDAPGASIPCFRRAFTMRVLPDSALSSSVYFRERPS